jgi:hypothetical protein
VNRCRRWSLSSRRARSSIASKRLRRSRRDARQECELQQRIQARREVDGDQVLGEVGEHLLERFAARARVDRFAASRALDEQRHRRGPPIGGFVQLPHHARVEVGARVHDLAGLLEGEADVARLDERHAVARQERDVGPGRLHAARHQHADAFGHFLEGGRERPVQRTVIGDLVDVVEHQRRAAAHVLVERSEVVARERGDVGAVRGRERRQRRGALAALEPFGGEAEVMEERGRIIVAAVDLVPDRRNAARLEVAREKRRLAGARLRRDPHDRTAAQAVEAREKPLARERVARTRA